MKKVNRSSARVAAAGIAAGPIDPPAPVVQHPKAPSTDTSRHGRAVPYNPTPQTIYTVGTKKTKWNKVKGNPPAGVGILEWDLAFNRADSNGFKNARDLAKVARENGQTRDVAIDELIRSGVLAHDFQDINP